MTRAEHPESLEHPGSVALGPEDRAILALESATVVGHVCHVFVLAPDGPDAAAVTDRVRAGLEAAPELRYRLGGTADHPVWVPAEDLDLSVHILDRTDEPLDERGLRAFVAERFGEHLDRGRPLWTIDVVRLVDGATALVWRLHHALADGTTFIRLARTVLFDTDQAATDQHHVEPSAPTPTVIARDHAHRRAHLLGFLRREFAVAAHRSPFDGVIGTRRAVAFADTSLPELHAAARAGGATLNDALLAVVAGALRRWLTQHGAAPHELRVRVPVSLHHSGSDALNRDSYFTLDLPLHIADPLERLRAVHRATSVRKKAHDAEQMDLMLHQLAASSPGLQLLVAALQASPREFAVNISNVPGPSEPVSITGRPVTAVLPVAEIGPRHALRVGAMSVGKTLSFGLCADPAIVEDLDLLRDGLEQEITRLVAATTDRTLTRR